MESDYADRLIAVIITFCVSRRPREMYCGHARLCVSLSVCLSAAACLHYCMDPDVTWEWYGIVHYWADLQSVHGLRCYGNTMEIRGSAHSGNPSGPPHAARTTHACGMRRAAKTPLTGDKINEPAACAVPFRPYCGCLLYTSPSPRDS